MTWSLRKRIQKIKLQFKSYTKLIKKRKNIKSSNQKETTKRINTKAIRSIRKRKVNK